MDSYYSCQTQGHRAREYPDKLMKTPLPSSMRCGFISDQIILDKLCPRCGQKCVIKTSQTAANPGRKFYKCPDNLGRNDHFFQWCDASTPDKRQQVVPSPKPSMVISDQGQDIPQSQYPVCSCGAGICSLRISKTERNRERKFFVCPIKRGQGACNFLQWEDGLGNVTPDELKNEIENSTPILTSDSPEDREEMYVKMSKKKNIDNLGRIISPGSTEKMSSRKHYIEKEVVGLDMKLDDHLDLNIGDLTLHEKKTGEVARPGACFRCGKEGHWTRGCNRSSSRCYRCGEDGHWRNECTA